MNKSVLIELAEMFCNSATKQRLSKFKEAAEKKDPTLLITKVYDHKELAIIEFENCNTTFAIVFKDGRQGIDLNVHDKESPLFPISEEFKDEILKIIDEIIAIYNKYATVQVRHMEMMENLPLGPQGHPQASEEEEAAVLQCCIEVTEALDGKSEKYSGLKATYYRDLVLVSNQDDKFIIAIDADRRGIGATIDPNKDMQSYSKAVNETLLSLATEIREKLPNDMSDEQRSFLGVLENTFANLPEDKQKEVVKVWNERKNKKS